MTIKSKLTNLADSVRDKCGINGLLTLDGMSQAIENYTPGGGYSDGDVLLGKCNVPSGVLGTFMSQCDPEDPHRFVCWTGGVELSAGETSDFYETYAGLVEGGWVFENLTVIPVQYSYHGREFVGSNTGSTQYIDIGLKSKSTLKHQIKYSVKSGNGGTFYGSRESGGDYRMFYAYGTCYWDIGATDMQYRLSFSDQTGTTQVHEYEFGNFYVKDLVTGNIKAGSQYDVKPIGESTGNIRLFYGSDYGRVYYLKVFDENTLVRDFRPVTRISDGKPGFIELVNYVFYPSAGSSDFGDIGELTGEDY